MLTHSLASAEWTGNRGRTALSKREECVKNPLTRKQWNSGIQFFSIGPADSHRPLLQHGNLFLTSLSFKGGNRLLNSVIAGLGNAFDLTRNTWRNHNLVGDNLCFRDLTQNVARLNFIAFLHKRRKTPFLGSRKTWHIHTALNKITGHLLYLFQRTLNTVIDHPKKTRTKLNRKRGTRALHHSTRLHANSFFINLDNRFILFKLDDLTDKPLIPNPNHFIHLRTLHAIRSNNRTSNL
ncbi:hypothetical protein BMS3Abin16_00296 [archaeon BMS3Abin16]|nr:hypothetical protein BMS3Abin16_00296 [archaeon BMS3Abin16]